MLTNKFYLIITTFATFTQGYSATSVDMSKVPNKLRYEVKESLSKDQMFDRTLLPYANVLNIANEKKDLQELL
jgi:hypothetical protein